MIKSLRLQGGLIVKKKVKKFFQLLFRTSDRAASILGLISANKPD